MLQFLGAQERAAQQLAKHAGVLIPRIVEAQPWHKSVSVAMAADPHHAPGWRQRVGTQFPVFVERIQAVPEWYPARVCVHFEQVQQAVNPATSFFGRHR
jgi:hypothetical protein